MPSGILVSLELVGMQLRAHILHEVHDQGLLAPARNGSPESRSILADLEHGADRNSDVCEDKAAALEGRLLQREQVQIVRRPMAEVKARECGASGQEEAALALEECVEDLALERGQLARYRGGHGDASLR